VVDEGVTVWVKVGEKVAVSVAVAVGSEVAGVAVRLTAGAAHPAAKTRKRKNGRSVFGLITN